MWLGLLVPAALAAPTLPLELSPDAEIVVLPRAVEDRAEIAIYRNLHPVRPQVIGRTLDGARKVEVLSVGGGTSFITILLRDPGLVPAVDRSGREATLSLRPGKAAVVATDAIPTLEALIQPGRPRIKEPLPVALLRPLDLDGRESTRPAETWIVPHPTFSPQHGPCAELLQPPRGAPTIDDAERYRRALVTCGRGDPLTRVIATRRLAYTYLDIGLPREASAYLDRLGDVHDADLQLARARAELTVGHTDVARAACIAAAKYGAPERQALRCLGAVSLVTADPPPTEVARRLALDPEDEDDERLAAELLLRDRRAQEALPLLQHTQDTQGLLAYGDALFAVGRTIDARRAWQRIKSGPLVPLATLRVLMSNLVEAGPRRWAAKVPLLEQTARQPNRVGIEARWLLVQIAEAYGDPETSAEHLDHIMDQDRLLAWRSEVPERLVAACSTRISQLHRAGRHADAVRAFERCWREGLDDVVADETALEYVVADYRALGLSAQALDVQRRIVNIESADGREELDSVRVLAELFVDTGRVVDALDAIAWVRAHAPKGKKPVPDGRIDRLEARALVLRGDLVGARVALLRAIADPATAEAATVDLATLDARTGHCEAAIPVLEPRATADTELLFALTRCLIDVGRPADAMPAAQRLIDTAATPADVAEAQVLLRAAWLAAGRPKDVPLTDTLGQLLVADEQATAALLERAGVAPRPPSAREALDQRLLDEKKKASGK